jgi:hypothetical protein
MVPARVAALSNGEFGAPCRQRKSRVEPLLRRSVSPGALLFWQPGSKPLFAPDPLSERVVGFGRLAMPPREPGNRPKLGAAGIALAGVYDSVRAANPVIGKARGSPSRMR